MAKCDHDPIEQVRGDLSSSDHFDVVGNTMDETRWVRELPNELHTTLHNHLVSKSEYEAEVHKDNATDVRIICQKCHLTTGWMKVDAPGMPAGIGLPAVRARWEEIKDLTSEELNALHRSKGVRPKMKIFSGV